MNGKLGVMQGRLTNKNGFYPQMFPENEWEKEFRIAKKYGISILEWMLNEDGLESNPLWSKNGRKLIKNSIHETGVMVDSICANIFMKRCLAPEDETSREKAFDIFVKLMQYAELIGAKLLVIPLFEKSEINLLYDLSGFLKAAIKYNDMLHIKIALEMNEDAIEQQNLIKLINSDRIGVCYDIGNAIGRGCSVYEDIFRLRNNILEIHIKDKKVGGTSVMLGEGDTDFYEINKCLEIINYHGNFVLESYFDKNAIEDLEKNYMYIRSIFYE